MLMPLSPFNSVSDLEIRLHPVPEALWKSLSRGQLASRELYRLRLQAEHALLVSGFDELVCLDLLKFTPFDYQVRAAQIALRHFRGRGMLCDEVGLGKTIEAGHVLNKCPPRNPGQHRPGNSPPRRVRQWREELDT